MEGSFSGVAISSEYGRDGRAVRSTAEPEQGGRRRTVAIVSPPYCLTVTVSPHDLLAEPPIHAAVAALAERNRHHYESMSEEERAAAVGHWRELAVSVLTAAAAALERPPGTEPEVLGPGRAIVVFEDAGGDQVTVQASFFPELQDVGDGGVAGTPAQAMALELLQEMAGEAQEEPE